MYNIKNGKWNSSDYFDNIVLRKDLLNKIWMAQTIKDILINGLYLKKYRTPPLQRDPDK